MARERNEVIYSIRVEDIYLVAESYDRGESDLTPEVIEKVIQKIESILYNDMQFEVINEIIEVVIEEEKEEQDVTIH